MRPNPPAAQPLDQPPGPAFPCEHGAVGHSGAEPAVGTAPERARSWLLIEFDGPWPAQVRDAALPEPLGRLALRADDLGLRVQLIRRPGRRPRPAAASAEAAPAQAQAAAVFVGWTAGPYPWLRRGDAADAGSLFDQLAALPGGAVPAFGAPVTDPLYLVCTNGRRDVCCARFGGPLARALGAAHPAPVWETTHVGGHRYAANLVLLPHGLYYGPVDEAAATAAVDAYQHGEIAPGRYRGRAGLPQDEQRAGYQRMTATGDFALG
jgi:hypothetical protein